MLFMTDGSISTGEDDKSKLLDKISNLNSGVNASIFTYSFGQDADTEIV